MVKTTETDSISVRLAESAEEVEAAQHLRYKVFYEEYSAIPTEEMAKERRDFDEYDPIADHLVVVDRSRGNTRDNIVGTYRLLRQEIINKHGNFYTSSEFDISPLLTCGHSLLELGRSCVLPEYRTRPVMQLLWQGIAGYISHYNVQLMFGCASIHETDISKISSCLSYMYHFHLAPEELRPRALGERYVNMNLTAIEDINPREVFNTLPPLIKGYLRLGAYIGDGAIVDDIFQTTDVCIVLPTHLVTDRYRRHYARTTTRIVSDASEAALEAGSVMAQEAAQ